MAVKSMTVHDVGQSTTGLLRTENQPLHIKIPNLNVILRSKFNKPLEFLDDPALFNLKNVFHATFPNGHSVTLFIYCRKITFLLIPFGILHSGIESVSLSDL